MLWTCWCHTCSMIMSVTQSHPAREPCQARCGKKGIRAVCCCDFIQHVSLASASSLPFPSLTVHCLRAASSSRPHHPPLVCDLFHVAIGHWPSTASGSVFVGAVVLGAGLVCLAQPCGPELRAAAFAVVTSILQQCCSRRCHGCDRAYPANRQLQRWCYR